MSFLTPSGWIRQPGYPDIQSGNGSGINLTEQFVTDWDYLNMFSAVPAIGATYDLESPVSQIQQLTLKNYSIKRLATGSKALITLIYSSGEGTLVSDDDVTEYYLDVSTLEKPLEKKTDNYLTKWNYDLYEYQDDDGARTVPAWFNTATDRSDATGAKVNGQYMWSQDIPGGFWYKVGDRTKPGQESFLVPSVTVQEKTFYRSKKSVYEAAATIMTIEEPGETFGKDDGQWLVMSVSVQRDGRRYLVERQFVWAEAWDSDLYTAGA